MPARKLEKWAGAVSVAAGAVHGVVTPDHFAEWWGYGLFFIFAGAAQILFGLALLTDAINPKDMGPHWRSWTRGLYVSGIAGNVAIMVLYAVTRTVGIPFFGPEAGQVEPVAPIDILSKALEIVLVLLLVLLIRATAPSETEATAPPPVADEAP